MAVIRTEIFERPYSVVIDGRRVPLSFDHPGFSVAVWECNNLGESCSHAHFLSRAEAEAYASRVFGKEG